MSRRRLGPACELVLVAADITTLAVDAIVNAANERMLGGGGVDGAIHRAAGPELRAACERVPEVRRGVRCPTGEARITPGFALRARHVIHTVGPVYRDPKTSGPLLASAYRASLACANGNGLKTIAFVAISCGVFGYPLKEAANIAISTCRDHHGALTEVWFALFGGDAMRAFEAAAARCVD